MYMHVPMCQYGFTKEQLKREKARKEKNWGAVVQLALRLMAEAEQNYTNGEDKKNYVMSSIKAMENTLQYDIDENAISELIDAVEAATKKINTK